MAHRVALKTTYVVEKVIDPIYSGGDVALDEYGRLLASSLGDDCILTNIETGARLARIEGDGEAVTSLSLTPDGSHLIICSRSTSMRFFALPQEDGSIEPKLARTVRPHSSPVATTAVDRTGTILATGGSDGVVKVWDLRGGFTTHTLHGHSGVISALRFFDANVAATHSSSREKEAKKRKRHNVSVDENQLEASDQGYRLASASEDGQIKIWNLHTRKSVATLQSHVSVVKVLDFDRAHGLLLSASRDKTVIIWNASTWTVRNTIPILESVEGAGLLKDPSMFYTAGEHGRVRIWSTKSGDEITNDQSPRHEEKSVVQSIYYSSLNFVLTVHADQTLLIHSLIDLHEKTASLKLPLPVVRQISGTHDDVIDLALLGQRKDLLAVATNLEDLRVLSLQNEKSRPDNFQNTASSQSYFGADVGLLQGHEDIIICLDVDWSGNWIATGAKDNNARLWRIDASTSSFQCYGIFTGHAESLGAIALSHTTPDLSSAAYQSPLDHPPPFLVTGSQDKTVKRWETSTIDSKTLKAARATYTRKAHDKDINAMDTNYNSTLFASASQDRTVKIWSLEDGAAVGVLRGHKRGVWSVKFAPKGTPAIASIDSGNHTSSSRGLILTGSGDKTVRLWNLADYACIRTFEGHTNSVLKVIWLPLPSKDPIADKSPASRSLQVASAAGDGLVKIWDVQSGELTTTLDNHTDRVWALTCNPDTNALISGGGDSVITFWKDTTQTTASTASQAATERVEQDQALQNYIRAKSYRKAIVLALQLNHPARLLGLFSDVCAKYPRDDGSLTGVNEVDDVLRNLSDDQLMALLRRLRDWNSNAKTAPIAQRILWTLVKSYPPSKFIELGKRRKSSKQDASVKDILEALSAYTERHYRRIEDLIDESYLLDYLIREMDNIVGMTG